MGIDDDHDLYAFSDHLKTRPVEYCFRLKSTRIVALNIWLHLVSQAKYNPHTKFSLFQILQIIHCSFLSW